MRIEPASLSATLSTGLRWEALWLVVMPWLRGGCGSRRGGWIGSAAFR